MSLFNVNFGLVVEALVYASHLSLLGFYPELWQVCTLSINLLMFAGVWSSHKPGNPGRFMDTFLDKPARVSRFMDSLQTCHVSG